MSQSLKVNYIYSLIGTLSGILFPLITFPYATRIMEADGMGQISFFSSIISYISLFTSIGIPIYAIREIARVRDDVIEMNKTVIEILLLHTMLTLLGYFIVAVLCVTITKITIDIPLFLILSLGLLFNAIGCEWFYKGIEDFKYITIRGILVRIIYVILLFSCVRSKSDILLYALITIIGTVGNNAFNFYRLKKYVFLKRIRFNELDIFKHLRPSLRMFVLNLTISLYVNLDTVMIGFLKDSTAVGYYGGAYKIANLLLCIIQALQTAMIPRFSYLAKEENKDIFNLLVQKVVDFVVTICIPMTFGLYILAPSLICLFCGPSYTPAIVTLQIISPIIIMISLSGIVCFQILYPLGHEKIAIWSTATGALANMAVCFFLIKIYGHNGGAMATLIGETTVTITMFLYGRKYIHIKYSSYHYLNCCLGSLLMFLSLWGILYFEFEDWQNVLIMPIVGIIVYGLFLYIRRDDFFMYILGIVTQRIKK